LASQEGDALILPRGYLETLLTRINDAGLPYEIDDMRLKLPKIDLGFHGELRDYQSRALAEMTRYGRGVLVAPCGSGKTALGMALISHWRQPALVLVHTRQLAEQIREAVKKWLKVEAGMIGDSVFDVRPVTVGIVQSLAGHGERVDEVKNRFGLVLLDEAHHCPANTFTEVLQQFPAAFRYGLTATPTRRDGLGSFMAAVLGPVRHEITAEDLRRAGVLVVPDIEWMRTDFYCSSDEWVDIIGALVKDEGRNRLIFGVINRLLNEGRQIIALSERVAHAEMLTRLINADRPGEAEVVTGSMSKKKRDAAMERTKSGEARILFSTKLADEGLDLPDLNALVLLTPSRNGGRTVQRVGRVLRAVPGKPQPVVVDMVDPHVGILWSQARSRYFDAYRQLAPPCRLPEWLEHSNKRSVA
jgi:superfamily II DNA or RNA helicase